MRPPGHRAAPRPRRAAPINPLAPLSERAIRRQTTHDVQAQVAPLAALINKRALAGSTNISGVAQALASRLGGYAGQAQDIYSKAQGELGGVDQALAAKLGAGGLGGQSNAGAVAAGFAKGGAERGQLISQGASAAGYAAKLPGLAELGGLQGVSDRQAQAQSQLGDLTAKTPGLIAQALADARNREYQKAVARLGFQQNIYSADLGYKAKTAATAETARGHTLGYKAKVRSNEIRQNAITAANDRSGKTLAERAREHNRSLDEQRRHDDQTYRAGQQRAAETRRHNRAGEAHQRRTEKSKKKSGSASGLGG